MKGIAVYVLISFGLAWLLWEIALILGLPAHSPFFQLVVLPGTLSPAIAAFVVRKWVTREGFADAGLNPILSRWRYYLVGLLLPLLVVAIIIILSIALGMNDPSFSIGVFPTIAASATIGVLISMFFHLGQEFGWRGYLQLRLFPHQPVLAATATGIIWSLWHYLPINLSNYQFSDQSVLGMLVNTTTFVLLSIIFGWLRVKAGSIWAPSLAHAATNTVGSPLAYSIFADGPNWIFVSSVGILAWIPLGILCVWIVVKGQLKGETAFNQ